jgi:hypothetical protein
VHAINPEPRLLFCPNCGGQHEDFGEWRERAHRTHLCQFCKHTWRPFAWTTVGVALPPTGDRRVWTDRKRAREVEQDHVPSLLVKLATFEEMYEYSCTMPTGPKPGSYWRRRSPYRSYDRDSTTWHHLGVAVPMPNDPPGEITIVWRRLLVVEWVPGEAVAGLLGAVA